MSNINRDYHIKLDVKTSKVIGANSIYFFSSDKNTCNLYIEIVNAEVDEKLELMIIIVPPNAQDIKEVYFIDCTKHSSNLFEVQLPNDEVGKYKVEIVAKVGAYENTSERFYYEVKPSVLL